MKAKHKTKIVVYFVAFVVNVARILLKQKQKATV